jgi:hypothetical protein
MKKKTRIFASKKSIQSDQLGCWVDAFLDVEFLENGLIKLTVQHIAKGMNGRTHTFNPEYLTEKQWEAVESFYTDSFIEY